MESDSPLTPKTIMHLLEHCSVSIAFVDGVTNDIIVHLFIRLDKRRSQREADLKAATLTGDDLLLA